jgi:hypothetical protein
MVQQASFEETEETEETETLQVAMRGVVAMSVMVVLLDTSR